MGIQRTKKMKRKAQLKGQRKSGYYNTRGYWMSGAKQILSKNRRYRRKWF